MLERRPGRPVLLVCGDEKLPEPIEPLRDPARDPDLSHALGLLLGPQPDSSDGSPAVALSLERASSDAPQEGDPLPRALAFLRFLLGPDEELCLRDPPRSWRFRKV